MTETQPRILVVDDREENLFAMKTILRKLDAELVCVASGEEALKASLENEFCLAIVDVQMPGMDGYELVELLRSNANTGALPVIFVSAIFSDEYHYRKGYDAGAVDFLSKPVNADILLSKVKVFIQLWQQKLELQHLVSSLQDWNTYLEKTVRERTEAVKTANAALSGQLKLQNELLAAAAGELNAALAPIRNSAAGLGKLTQRNTGQLEPVKAILAGEMRIREIAAALEDLTALGDRLSGMARGPVSLSEVVASACSDCQSLLEEQNLTIAIENLNRLPAVQADEQLLRMLFRQAILHALHHSQEGGEVLIAGERAPAGSLEQFDRDALRVKIAFRGPGLDRDYHQWIAGIFQQPERTPAGGPEKTAPQRGSSLGLAMAHKIAAAHGGLLWAEAQAAEEHGPAGVAFHIIL